MNEVRTCPLTEAEFSAFRRRLIRAYAAAHVRAGDWSPDRAEALATEERMLLRVVEETAREHGCETVGLSVFADNTTAQTLYESSGYELAAMRMRKRLE